MSGYSYRRAGPDDADQMAATMRAGFEGYRSIAPAGWQPPTVEPEPIRVRLADTLVWGQVAERDGAMAGHVTFMPATLSSNWPDEGDPALAHFWQLFVREEHWGSGVAGSLHAAAVAEAGERGFRTFRLYTPAKQLRARRFYEREGWSAAGAAFLETSFGMELLQYRRPLGFT